MSVCAKRWELELNADLNTLWEFISNPMNLAKITPSQMSFKVLSEGLPSEIYPGLMIHYSLKPFPGYSTQWLTEITHVEKGSYFVDEQRHGPYKLWHHEHFIEEQNGKVLMRDILHYSLPFGMIGQLLNSAFISAKIEGIFEHRRKAMLQLFPE